MTPPLRDHNHQNQLWRGLRTDDLQVVSTDHCPFCFNEQPYGMKYSKQQGADDFSKIPNGAPGVETRMPLIFEGAVGKHGMSINRFVEITSTAPAKLFGIFPRKGTIAVGSDGDIVLFDPDEVWTIRAAEHHTRSTTRCSKAARSRAASRKCSCAGNASWTALSGRAVRAWGSICRVGEWPDLGESGRI
jgi:dihydropyrimidinase